MHFWHFIDGKWVLKTYEYLNIYVFISRNKIVASSTGIDDNDSNMS